MALGAVVSREASVNQALQKTSIHCRSNFILRMHASYVYCFPPAFAEPCFAYRKSRVLRRAESVLECFIIKVAIPRISSGSDQLISVS